MKKDITLVIMAAGIGSRYGGGIKQLASVGPSGEIIMDYSVYDALEAGFNKIVFVIRKDLEVDFKEIIGNRMEQICHVEYAFQEKDDLPAGFTVPEGRTKPWGTGQAVLACKDIVKEPFVVINADDYYGKEAFVKIHDYLVEHAKDQYNYCMAGFILENTLSENGGVTRGVCKVDENGHLVDVDETSDIIKTPEGAGIAGSDRKIDAKSNVSMNMWGLTPEFIDILEHGFVEFLENLGDNPLKAEYLLPIIMDKLIKEKKASVTVLETPDKWFGVTYADDREMVVGKIQALVDAGVYPSPLF